MRIVLFPSYYEFKLLVTAKSMNYAFSISSERGATEGDEKVKRGVGIYFVFLTEILSARKKLDAIKLQPVANRSLLIVYSEVN